MAARSHHGHLCHVQDLAGAVARIRARQAGPPGEDRPAVLRHRVVDEQPLHPHLVADANVPDASATVASAGMRWLLEIFSRLKGGVSPPDQLKEQVNSPL